MKKSFITILLVGLCFLGRGQKLTGTIFEIGPNKMDCKIYGECDCCTSSLFFLDEVRFALFDFCTFDYTLTTGTYKIENQILTLTFKPVSVLSGQDPTEDNSKPYLERQDVAINPLFFSFGKCENGELMLVNDQFQSYKYGLRDSLSESLRMTELMDSKEWKLLND